MADTSPRLRDLLRNVRLANSWPVIFTFGINFVVTTVLFWILVLDKRFRGLLPEKIQIYVAFGYVFLSTIFVPMAVANWETRPLWNLGWEQRPTRAGNIDLWSCIGLCVAYINWVNQNRDWADLNESGVWAFRWAVLQSVGVWICLWLGMLLMFMGRIWWFTKRANEA